MPERIWTVSNILSMLRIALIIPVSFLLSHESTQYHIYALIVIVAASLTDFFDGMIARRMNQVTEFGKIIDPIADKICIGFIFAILAIRGQIPVWLFGLTVVRDIAIAGGGWYIKKSRGIIPMSNMAGKLAVASLALLVVVAILEIDALLFVKEILIMLSTALLLVSSVLYAIRFRKMLKEESDHKISET